MTGVQTCALPISFTNIPGNGLWTHSLYSSPRLSKGRFESNTFDTIGRDALQAGHIEEMIIASNTGRRIGWPYEAVDVENGGTPVAIDTAGNVSNSRYENNRFDEINGKCFDLDGFHDGAVTGNTCTNRSPVATYPHGHFGLVMNNTNPDMRVQNIVVENNVFDGMKYGAIFLMGTGHRIANNKFLNVDLVGCNESSPQCVYKADEPEMLQSGIYLGRGVARMEQTRDNLIENNTITGHKMGARCIAYAPGVDRAVNPARQNDCRDAILDVHAH